MDPMRNALDEPTGPSAPTGPSTASSTGLLERTETRKERTDGDGDRFAHFVRKDKANSSMVTGQPVVALCGKVWIPTRDASQPHLQGASGLDGQERAQLALLRRR